MKTPRILVFGGSLRAESFNQKLATLAADAARAAGAEVTLITLRDFRMPLFDEDLEAAEGMPQSASELKALFAAHDGLIIASPEYNSTITAALKNAIDWVSRATEPDEAPLSVLSGKSAAILSASPGGYGGSRSLAQLRPFLVNIGIFVMPDQVTVAKAHEAFDADGHLIDPAQTEAVKALAGSLVAKLA
ncbi:NAD(P)H-dependent oxidoreductase [bacterium]|nr:NAD(P)H-dependent oxidoreductase [bacterium]